MTTLSILRCVVLACVVASAPTLTAQGPAARTTPSAPQLQVDPFWPKPLPNNWILGQVSGVAVDKRGHVWIIQRPRSLSDRELGAQQKPAWSKCCVAAPPVIVFDQSGNVVRAWGGQGAGYEWPESEHGVFVDDTDSVWIAGNGNKDSQILKFTLEGKFVLQIGKSGQSKGSNDTANLGSPADINVDIAAREVYVADGYRNRRVIVFDSETGKFKRMWGAFGNPPPPTFAANAPAPQAQTTPDGPPEFGLPHAIKVSRDGVVYLADRINNRIQLFTRDGKFLKQVRVTNEGSDVVPVPAGFAFSPDTKQQFLYVVDSGPMRVVIFDREKMTQIGTIGMRGPKPGDFDIVHHMAADSKGNLYTAEIVTNRRAQRFVLTSK